MEDRENLSKLPTGWILTKFEELSEAIPNALKAGPFGSALKKEFYVSQGYKIYGQEQVIREDPFYGDYYIDEERYKVLKSCAVKTGDILISLVGTIGKVLVLPEGIEPGIINPRLVKLSLEKKLISTDYIKAYLESSVVRSYLSSLSHGGTMDILNLTILKTLPITLPPLNEQRRIVAKIEALKARSQRVKEELEYIPQLLDQFRQSVLAAAFRGDLTADWREQNSNVEPAEVLLERTAKQLNKKLDEFPQKNDIQSRPFIPDNWVWTPLDLVIKNIQSGKNFTCPETPVNENTVGLVKISAVTWGKFDDRETKTVIDQSKIDPNLFIQKGDFLISRANTLELVGASVIVDEINYKIMISDKVWRVSFLEVNSSYVNSYLKSKAGRKEIESRATGNQLSMRNISQGAFKDIIIALPPLDEQKEIVRQIQYFFKVADTIQQQYQETKDSLNQLDQSILAKAFRGELVPQDPNDEPASVLLERIRAERAKLQTKTAKKSTLRLGSVTTTKTSARRTKKTQPQQEESVQLELGLE